MSNWRKVESFITYYTKGIAPNYVNKSSVLVINQRCIRNNKIDFSLARYTDETKTIAKNKVVKVGDILFNSTGQGTAGRCAYIEWLPEEVNVVIDSHVLLLRCHNEYEAKCLSYILHSFEKTIQSFMDGSTGQGELDKIRLLNINVSIPEEISTLKKISNIFSLLDKKMEINKQINTELEIIAKTIYDYWFVQFEFPDENGKPYKSSGGKMVFNEELNREIPSGWEVTSLCDHITLSRGVTYNKNDIKNRSSQNTAGILRATNITLGNVDKNNLVYVSKNKVSKNQYINKYETLIVMSSGSKEHIGKNGIYYFDECLAYGAFCSKISPQKNWVSYINSFLKSDWFNAYIKHQCLGTNINNLTNEQINKCKILKPNIDTLQLFEKKISLLQKIIEKNTVENELLKQLLDFLLPLLMNGQVMVK